MRDENEVVTIEMSLNDRILLCDQITDQMERMGLNYRTWGSLDLGFDLPDDWPVDVNEQPTISQLIVFAIKLKMRVVISDLNMVPASDGGPDNGN